MELIVVVYIISVEAVVQAAELEAVVLSASFGQVPADNFLQLMLVLNSPS